MIDSLVAGTGTISSGTAQLADSGGFVFGADGVSLVTAGYQGISAWNNGLPKNAVGVSGLTNTVNLSLQRAVLAQPLLATRADLAVNLSAPASGAGSVTISLAAYTFVNATEVSLASSATVQISWANGSATSAASAYGGQSGLRWRSVPLASWNLVPGDYLIAAAISLASPSKSQVSASYLGSRTCDFGIVVSGSNGGNVTDYFFHGAYSKGTAALPASIAASQVVNTQSQNNFQGSFGQPYLQLAGSF